jgi:hypothetical protein
MSFDFVDDYFPRNMISFLQKRESFPPILKNIIFIHENFHMRE